MEPHVPILADGEAHRLVASAVSTDEHLLPRWVQQHYLRMLIIGSSLPPFFLGFEGVALSSPCRRRDLSCGLISASAHALARGLDEPRRRRALGVDLLQGQNVILATLPRQFPEGKLNLLEVLRLARRRLEQWLHGARGPPLFPRFFIQRLSRRNRSLERVDWDFLSLPSLKVVHRERARSLLVPVLIRHDLVRAGLDVLVRLRLGDLLTKGVDLLTIFLTRGADGLEQSVLLPAEHVGVARAAVNLGEQRADGPAGGARGVRRPGRRRERRRCPRRSGPPARATGELPASCVSPPSHQPAERVEDPGRRRVIAASSSSSAAAADRVHRAGHRVHPPRRPPSWSARHASSVRADGEGSEPTFAPEPARASPRAPGSRRGTREPYPSPPRASLAAADSSPPSSFPLLLDDLTRSSATNAAALVTISRHSARAGASFGATPGAGGGGRYSNPGDSGRTDVCAAPTW